MFPCLPKNVTMAQCFSQPFFNTLYTEYSLSHPSYTSAREQTGITLRAGKEEKWQEMSPMSIAGIAVTVMACTMTVSSFCPGGLSQDSGTAPEVYYSILPA